MYYLAVPNSLLIWFHSILLDLVFSSVTVCDFNIHVDVEYNSLNTTFNSLLGWMWMGFSQNVN